MSQHLDPRAYDREVVAPLRKAHGALPDDLLTRYAVELSMTAEELRRRVGEVEALWNAKADGPGLGPAVYRAFRQAHEDLLRDASVRLDDPRWWQARAAQRAADARREAGELAGEARQAYGPVGFILPGQLADLAKRYLGLRETEVMRAIGQAGIAVITPRELPQRSGLDPLMYDKLQGKLAEAGTPTVAHLLHPGVASICLYQNPGGAGPALTRLDAETLERRVKAAETEANSARSRAVTAALRILSTAAGQGTDLRQLAVFQILGKARETVAAGQPAVLTLRSLQELGLTEWDAQVLTASLIAAEGSRAAGGGGAEDVRRLVGAGQLSQARRLLAGLPAADPETAAAAELVAKAGADVAGLLAAAKSALAGGDEAEAARLASAARGLAADDPAVTGFADSLPPPPPQGLLAVADGLDVKLSWQPAPGSSGTLRYRVVRREGRPPIEPADGVIIADGPATTVRDAVPPAGRALQYGVFATAGTARWSRAAACEAEILPAVVDVSLRLARSTARCTWRMHPDAAAVIVAHRPDVPPAGPRDGRRVETAGARFTDAGLAPNVTHCYAITAAFRGENGEERLAGTVFVTVAAEEERKPVAALRAESAPGDGALRARISWRQRNSDDVQIRRARAACPWPFGAAVPRLDVQSYGEEVTGDLSVVSGRAALVAQMPSGHLFLTPFSFAGDRALVGQGVDVGFTAPIGAVAHERRDGEVLLSWQWPARASMAELRWTGQREPDKRITRGERARDDGWARIQAGSGAVRVEIRAIEVGPAGNATSSPQVVQIAGAESRLSYGITWKPVLPGATRRTCEVRVLAPAGCGAVTVVAIARPGIARPLRAEDGEQVGRWQGDLPASGTALIPVTVPKSFRKPYWLCCFLAGGSGVLADPPISQMRVG